MTENMDDVQIDPDGLLTWDDYRFIIASKISFINLDDLVLNLDCQPFTHGDHPWPSWSGFLKAESDLVWCA